MIDEHPDSINDAACAVQMPAVTASGVKDAQIIDFPAAPLDLTSATVTRRFISGRGARSKRLLSTLQVLSP
jgi:hypothetical protein